MTRYAPLLAITLVARPVLAQSEDALRTAFEGKTVRVKIEMPGSSDGVDIYPGAQRPLDLSRHASRLKDFGIAYHIGESAMVTKVHIKGDHIEFQLGAGGFGTFGDNTSTTVSVPVADKTQREKDLERDIKTVTDPDRKRRMRDELDRLRSDREKENARNASRAAQAQAIKEATVRQRRLEGGSRFNIRFDHDVPPAAATPDAVMAALADYVDFSTMNTMAPPPVATDLHKGMLADDVDALLGRPESISQRMEGTLSVSTSVYRTRDRKITAEFVEGVLVRFQVVSQ